LLEIQKHVPKPILDLLEGGAFEAGKSRHYATVMEINEMGETVKIASRASMIL
jgi:hypothetical protein